MSSILSKVQASVWSTEGASSSSKEQHEEEKADSFDETLENGDRILLTYSTLNERQALQHVRHQSAGATVLFVGTTRNEFQGKSVQRLDYTAYSALAKKLMTNIINQQRRQSMSNNDGEPLQQVYLAHRLGSIDVKEPSILVCVSSAHRKASFDACEQLLEEVKRQLPIWKKEVYDGQHAGTSEWKANATKHWPDKSKKSSVNHRDGDGDGQKETQTSQAILQTDLDTRATAQR